MIIRNWTLLLFIISLISISSALIAEYFFNLQPCELCLKQRHPYYLILVSLVFIFIIKNLNKVVFYLLIQLASVYGLFYSIWHVGVENKILKGPSGCSVMLTNSESASDLKAQILSKQVISCDEVIWSFFGISAASINTLVLLVIFILNAIYLFKNYGTKKEKNV
ncbi:disulfide bond formation protein B [Pelagibacteraceae bacterium]|nr:disulfide bond formation protein B [Pelagibacteraceae bacterium]